MPSIMLEFNDDGSVTWKPAGSANRKGGGDAVWIDGPECPVHGAWSVVARKDGSGFFYSCKVPKGEDWCKNKAGKPWTENNPPTGPARDHHDEEDDFGYTSDEDLFG